MGVEAIRSTNLLRVVVDPLPVQRQSPHPLAQLLRDLGVWKCVPEINNAEDPDILDGLHPRHFLPPPGSTATSRKFDWLQHRSLNDGDADRIGTG